MGCFRNGSPDEIQAVEPAIGRGFITNLSPDAFLHIEAWLVARQISKSESSLPAQKTLHISTLVPSGSVHIEPDLVAVQLAADQLQAGQEALSVARGRTHEPDSSQQRCHPAKDVQPLAVLARRWDPKPFSDLGPSHTQTRMQAKTGLIFKDHGLPRPQFSKFFLTSCENSSLPALALEYTNSWPASVGTPADASTFAPVAPSALSRTDAPDASPGSVHPSGHDSIQTPGAPSPGLPPASPGSLESIAPGALDVFPALMPTVPVCSPCASRDSNSDASGLAPRRPIPDADPPLSATKPRSLTLRVLPGFPERRPQDALGSPLDASTSSLDFSWSQCGIV